MSTVLDNFLLYQLSKYSEDGTRRRSLISRRTLKYTLITFAVLLLCGLIAFGLSSLFFYFYDVPEISERHKYSLSLPAAAECGKRIVGYYTGWEPGMISEFQVSKLTHVIFVAVKMFGNGQIGFHNSEYSRRFFINSLSTFLSANKVDGLEIIWTFPFAEAADRSNLVVFLKELRAELTNLQIKKEHADPYVISMLTPQIIWKQLEGYDLEGILKYTDFLNVVSYEYYGPWAIKEGAYTGPVGPLYGGKRGNIDDTMKVHTCQTMKPNQLTLGIPLFGKFWRNVKEERINQTDTMCKEEICRIEEPEYISDLWRVSELSDGKPNGGIISWNDRENDEVGIFWNKSETRWDEISRSAYIWKPEDRLFITFETERSIKEKIKLLRMPLRIILEG